MPAHDPPYAGSGGAAALVSGAGLARGPRGPNGRVPPESLAHARPSLDVFPQISGPPVAAHTFCCDGAKRKRRPEGSTHRSPFLSLTTMDQGVTLRVLAQDASICLTTAS